MIPRVTLSDFFIKNRRWYWILALLLAIATLLSSISLLSTSGWFITTAAIAGLLAITINYLIISALIRAFALIRIATRYAGDLVSHNAVLYLLKDLRVKTFQYLSTNKTKLYHNDVNSIVATHRLAMDIDRLDLFPLRFLLPWLSTIVVVVVLLFIYYLAPVLLLYVLPAVLISWLVIPILSFFKGIQLAKDEIILSEQCKEQFVQSLSLLTPLLIWKTWFSQQQTLDQLDKKRLQKNFAQQNFISFIKMLQNIAMAIALVGMMIKGIDLVNSHLLTIPWLLAIILGLMALMECLSPLAGSSTSLGLSMFARDRINELIDRNHQKVITSTMEPESIESLELINISGRITNALNGPCHVSFEVKKGDILCIRGPSGIGKTTLLDLIAREIIETEGTILINHQLIDEWNLKNTLGYLPQHIDIFDFSLALNLRIAKVNASDDELWQVLEFVGLDDWARSRQGLETALGEYGTEVSGGQARRIALARLLLANRSLILLDEPFVGLDQNNIELLYRRLVNYAQDKIILIVSHHDLTVYGCQEYWLS